MEQDRSGDLAGHSGAGDVREAGKEPVRGGPSEPQEDSEPFPDGIGIRAGEAIKCDLCRKPILKARVDIRPNSKLKSEYLAWMDSTPVKPGDLQACPHCWAFFQSISTKTKLTIF